MLSCCIGQGCLFFHRCENSVGGVGKLIGASSVEGLWIKAAAFWGWMSPHGSASGYTAMHLSPGVNYDVGLIVLAGYLYLSSILFSPQYCLAFCCKPCGL